MKGSPMQRNFGIGSPVKDRQTRKREYDGKWIEEKHDHPHPDPKNENPETNVDLVKKELKETVEK